MNTFSKFILSFLVIFCLLSFSPVSASEKADLQISGWIPYWRADEGISDAKKHVSKLSIIYPFGFSVDKNGGIKDLFGLNQSSWKQLAKSAKSKSVQIIPTVMWSDAQAMNAVLSDPSLRKAHIAAIASMVKAGKYPGVDIDYEGKLAATKDYFSLFLKELKSALGSKTLTCAIEPRTPPDSLVSTSTGYANDYPAIGTYCDQVEIMTYDQGRADIKLNAANLGSPYSPIADINWVRKVALLAMQSIPKEKIMLGVATYGREYEITVSPNWFQGYRQLRSINSDDAEKLAKDYNTAPSRNSAGEMVFSYIPQSSSLSLSPLLKIPYGTSSGNLIAARALAYANSTGKTIKFNFVTWSNAEAIQDKVQLAVELGLRGVAIFKVDGREDQELWNVLGSK